MSDVVVAVLPHFLVTHFLVDIPATATKTDSQAGSLRHLDSPSDSAALSIQTQVVGVRGVSPEEVFTRRLPFAGKVAGHQFYKVCVIARLFRDGPVAAVDQTMKNGRVGVGGQENG